MTKHLDQREKAVCQAAKVQFGVQDEENKTLEEAIELANNIVRRRDGRDTDNKAFAGNLADMLMMIKQCVNNLDAVRPGLFDEMYEKKLTAFEKRMKRIEEENNTAPRFIG